MEFDKHKPFVTPGLICYQCWECDFDVWAAPGVRILCGNARNHYNGEYDLMYPADPKDSSEEQKLYAEEARRNVEAIKLYNSPKLYDQPKAKARTRAKKAPKQPA